MSKGWVCPSCGRGVSPDQKTCDHGGDHYRANQPTVWPPYPRHPWPQMPTVPIPGMGGCDACRRSGVCNCILGQPQITCLVQQ